jgi:hypothetical protein
LMKALRNWIGKSNSQTLATVIKIALVALKIGRFGEKVHLPYKLRVVVAELVTQTPFAPDDLSHSNSIYVMIPCVEKDLPFLSTCIEGVRRNVMNPVDKISIITNCPELVKSRVESTVEIISENGYLPQIIQDFISKNIPKPVQGWVSKQIIVMYCAYMSQRDGVLTVDADTILISPRKFLKNEKQILCPVVEYAQHDAFTTHKTWKSSGVSLGISFKAHHMLMKPKIVREMFDSLGGFEQGSIDWLTSTLHEEWVPFSEFHSYATWILNQYPNQVELVRWGNIRASRSSIESNLGSQNSTNLYEAIKKTYPTHNSVSFHHYLAEDFSESEVS